MKQPMSKVVVFRVDASLSMGSGHVMRCITLANALSIFGYDCHFICRKHIGHLNEKISANGFVVHELGASCLETPPKSFSEKIVPHAEWLGCDYRVDAEQALTIVATLKAELLVVDHYALDARWESVLRKSVPKILVIDDLADRDHDCDFLLDQTFGRIATEYQSLVPDSCQRQIGAEYALLRSEFMDLREASLSRRKVPELKHILVTLGGVDRENVTNMVLSELAQSDLPVSTQITVVMGGGSPNLHAVVALAETLQYSVDVFIDVNNISELMLCADLAIGASGSTTWERCCLGLPTLLVILADNQLPSALSVSGAGAAKLIGKPEDIAEKLPDLLAEVSNSAVLKSMSLNASAIVDGRGVSRVINGIGF